MDILPLLDDLRTIARNGLTYATNPFDQERYAHLLDLASAAYGEVLSVPADEARRRLVAELGYVTPKVGADGAIFDEDGRILLVLRADDQTWCLPGGWVDANESPAEAAVREVREETGLEARSVGLVDVFTRLPSVERGPHTVLTISYLCEVVGGEPRGSHETLEVRYWRIEDVPTWHTDNRSFALAARTHWQARRSPPH